MVAEKVVEKVRSRAAYRAVYLASPLKFHTTLHAFNRTLPQYRIEEWQKDPHAWEKHKWQTAKARNKGRWGYQKGPLTGVQLEGWPEPGLLGAGALVQAVARAQAERLQDQTFWDQVAERTHTLRDVISVSDLAVVLDALVTADHRHTMLMKTLARELADDADKMSLVEVAVVANAYAHFRCLSKPLMDKLAGQAAQLLSGDLPPYVRDSGIDSDPGSLSVLVRAFGILGQNSKDLHQAVDGAAKQRVDNLSLSILADLLTSFVKGKHKFQAEDSFWNAMIAKVPNSRMGTLCPALWSIAHLGAKAPSLREALVGEILKGVRAAPADMAPEPLGAVLGQHARLPTFAPAETPDQLMALLVPNGSSEVAEVLEGDEFLDLQQEPPSMFGADDDLMQPDEMTSSEPAPAPRLRWYNAVSRRPDLPAMPGFRNFDASANFARNRRGMRVGEALEGLNLLWQQQGSGAPSKQELELVAAAAPVLRAALQGLAPGQLVACAELYAARPVMVSGEPVDGIMRDIVQEAVRRSSNFSAMELKRLRRASLAAGVPDPYLEHARRRRFPKALRKELRDEEAAAAGSKSAE